MARPNYGLLRGAHEKELQENIPAIDQTRQPEQEIESPTRPEGHPGSSLDWTGYGGLVEQQASANAWIKANHERQGAHQVLEQHVEGGKSSAVTDGAAASWKHDLGVGTARREVVASSQDETSSESLNI